MNFQDAQKEFGSVTHNGVEIAMTQNAYVDNFGANGGVRYYSAGVDANGNTYEISWDTTQPWDDANDRINAAGLAGEEPDYIDIGMMQDESNACDWDSPASVVMTDEA